MDNFDMHAGTRQVSGKGTIRRLKRSGYIPGILYNKDGSVPVMLDAHYLKEVLEKHGDDVFINLHINGENVQTKIMEVQRDPVSHDILHIDLMPVYRSGYEQKYVH